MADLGPAGGFLRYCFLRDWVLLVQSLGQSLVLREPGAHVPLESPQFLPAGPEPQDGCFVALGELDRRG